MLIIIINVLLGLLLAFLFKIVLDKNNNIIVNGSLIHKVKNNIYKYNDKCYILDKDKDNK